MAITLSGVLRNGYGQPLPNARIRLEAVRHTSVVLSDTSAEAYSANDGSYSINVEPGRYDIYVQNELEYIAAAQNLEVRAGSTAKTLNQLLVAHQNDGDLTPAIVLEFRALTNEARGYRDDAAASADAASISSNAAASSAKSASQSASHASGSASAAASSASAANASKNAAATSATNSANYATAAKKSAAEAKSVSQRINETTTMDFINFELSGPDLIVHFAGYSDASNFTINADGELEVTL